MGDIQFSKYLANKTKLWREDCGMLFVMFAAVFFAAIGIAKVNVLGNLLSKGVFLLLLFIAVENYYYQKNKIMLNLGFFVFLMFMYRYISLKLPSEFALQLKAGYYSIKPAYYLIQLFANAIATVFFAYMFYLKYEGNIPFLKLNKTELKKSMGEIIIAVFLICCLAFLVNIINAMLFYRDGLKPIYYILHQNAVYIILAILVQVLYQLFNCSVIEEICFRGALFGILKEHYPQNAVKAFLINNTIFAAIHLYGQTNIILAALRFITAFLGGSILWRIREKTGSIYIPIILHTFNNITIVLLSQ